MGSNFAISSLLLLSVCVVRGQEDPSALGYEYYYQSTVSLDMEVPSAVMAAGVSQGMYGVIGEYGHTNRFEAPSMSALLDGTNYGTDTANWMYYANNEAAAHTIGGSGIPWTGLLVTDWATAVPQMGMGPVQQLLSGVEMWEVGFNFSGLLADKFFPEGKSINVVVPVSARPTFRLARGVMVILMAFVFGLQLLRIVGIFGGVNSGVTE